MNSIQMLNLRRQYLAIKHELDEAIQAVMDSTEFIHGSAVRDFESALAKYLNCGHVIGCASGTDALQVALMAFGIGPGDEVITSPFTFVATAETVLLLGARPVFVDIEEQTYNLDPDQIAGVITPKTKAIIPVHLYGHPAEMEPLLTLAKGRNLKVIEDAAQAIGAEYLGRMAGTLGEIGCLSFYPTKNLGACGDGGALICNDDVLAERCRMICNHGSRVRYHHELLGVNSRLDSIQAAVLKVKLRHLEEWTAARIRVAEQYSAGLKHLDLIVPYCSPKARHVYHQYSIRTSRRDEMAAHLKARGIGWGIHYPLPLHQQPAFKNCLGSRRHFPVAEAVSKEILCLPIYPELEVSEIDAVILAIREFFR